MRRFSPLVAVLVLFLACGESTGPEAPLRLEKAGGDDQVGMLEGAPPTALVGLEEPLVVRVFRDSDPVRGVEVRWEMQGGDECGGLFDQDQFSGLFADVRDELIETTNDTGRSVVTWVNQRRDDGTRECDLEASARGESVTFSATWRG